MNRSAINSTVLGSAGSVPFVVGFIRDTLKLAGAMTASVTKSAGMSVTMRLSAVGKGSRNLYGKAVCTLELIGLNIGKRNHNAYQAINQEMILEPKVIGYMNSMKFTPITQPMVLVGYESGDDYATGSAGRVIIVPYADRNIIVPAAAGGSQV